MFERWYINIEYLCKDRDGKEYKACCQSPEFGYFSDCWEWYVGDAYEDMIPSTRMITSQRLFFKKNWKEIYSNSLEDGYPMFDEIHPWNENKIGISKAKFFEIHRRITSSDYH